MLLPLLRAEVEIDGNDISADMLHHCHQKAVSEGFKPHLYNHPMHALEIPRQYKTMYICDSFGLAGSQEKDLETLKQCYAHLEEGGALLLNIEAEYTSPEGWKLWLKETRDALPEPWPKKGEGRIAADGSEHFSQSRLLHFAPLEQQITRQVRLEKWLNGALLTAEEYTLRGMLYFKNELLLMLRMAGFREITVCGDYTNEPATADHANLVFTAIR